MSSVILIAPKGTTAVRFAITARVKWSVRVADESHCLVENGPHHVIITAQSSIRYDYDKNELASVLLMVPYPQFFMCEFNDFRYGKEVLAELTDADDIFLDDDHGHLTLGRAFSASIRSNPEFDWR